MDRVSYQTTYVTDINIIKEIIISITINVTVWDS